MTSTPAALARLSLAWPARVSLERVSLARAPTVLRRRPQHTQVTAPAHFNPLPYRLGRSRRPGRLTDGVGKRLKVVRGGLLARRERKPDDVPAPRSGQPVRVRAAQVVAVRFDVGGKRPEHRRGIAVHVRQRADGISRAGRPGAAARTRASHLAHSSVRRSGASAAPPAAPRLAWQSERLRAPLTAGSRSSLTTADRTAAPASNAITRGTRRDRVLTSQRSTRRAAPAAQHPPRSTHRTRPDTQGLTRRARHAAPTA